MTQRTTVLCTNTISSMVFDVRARLLLENRLLFETWLLLEQCSQTPGLYLKTWLVYEAGFY